MGDDVNGGLPVPLGNGIVFVPYSRTLRDDESII